MGYNQSNNPFSRKASPFNAKCPEGWTLNPDKKGKPCLPPREQKPEPKPEPPSRRSSSPLNQKGETKDQPKMKGNPCSEGWTLNEKGNCKPPKIQKPKTKGAPSRRSSSPLNQVEEQVYEHELGHDEIYEDTRSGENYLAQPSYENPGYDEYGKKLPGKKARKERKLFKTQQQLKKL